MQLVAAALFFMFSVCLVPEHKAAVLSAGALTAILAGYARHATDDDVMTTFRDIVEVCTCVALAQALVSCVQPWLLVGCRSLPTSTASTLPWQ